MNRDFSKVSCRLFRSRKFRALKTSFEQLAYVYLLTSPHGNSGGCFEQPIYAMAADMGCSEEAVLEAIDSLSDGLIDYDPDTETVFLENWLTFNPPTNVKHAAGVVSQLAIVPSERLKNKSLQEFKERLEEAAISWKGAEARALIGKIDRLCIGYGEAIPTKTRLDLDKTRLRQDLDEDVRRIENPVCPETSAGDLKAALVPTDGGEGKGGKQKPPTARLKSLLQEQDQRGSRRVH